MENILVYSSKYGFTKEVSEYIKASVNEGISIFDVNNFDQSKIKEAKKIIFASSVYTGQMNKHIKELIKENKVEILNKKIVFLIVGGNEKEIKTVLSENVDEDILRNNPLLIYGGYSYNFEKLNFVYRYIVKKVAKISESKRDFREDNIKYMINELEL